MFMKTLHKNILGFTSLAFIIASEALAADDTHGLVYDIEHVDPHGPVGDASHEASAGLPQLDPTWFASQIFWLLIVFGALYFIFSRSILPALSTTLENRHEHIQSDLDTAERLKEEAETVQSNYEAVLIDARAKASTLYRDVEDDIKSKTEKEQSDLNERLRKEMELSEARILKSKKEALKDMDTIVAEIASDAAKKIVGIKTNITDAKNVVKDLNSKSKKAA